MLEADNIRALIGMLDESDPDIYQSLKEALFKVGEEAVPFLDEAQALRQDDLWLNRLDSLKRDLLLEASCRHLKEWKQDPEPDLLRGLYFISKAFYPDLVWETVRDEFNRLHGDCWLLLATASGLKESITLYNNFFFNLCKFRLGKRITHGYGLADFLLPNLINLKQGNERALAMVYQYLAVRNQIPVFLLSLPVINLLACTPDLSLKDKDDVRYCIDITQVGAMVNRLDIEPVFSQQHQIQLCSTVQALQDYAHLMHLMASIHEKDTAKKEAARRLHQSLGASGSTFAFTIERRSNDNDDDDE